MQREIGWGSNVVNRTCFSQWIALGFRLGMEENYSEHVKTLRHWLEQEGPVPSVDRGGYRVSGPLMTPSSSRVRRAREAFGADDDDNRRGRNRTRDDSSDRSRSRSRSRGLNSGTSGRFQGSKRPRRDY